MLVHKQIIIKGKVENTGFRFHAMRGACLYGICGDVRQNGNRILIEAEGEEESVDAFTAWCRQKHEFSTIESVTIQDKTLSGYSDFKIL